ncbi:NADH-quinone oxidoreductase subunit L [Nocardioides immobilis]|uniref:NADH-quinone oxidoreductase subunit L n=1 Tax=Nocardioides immobilis TaxID=2049295 RepID=A0A417Y1P3_9ACTN|nr:NADH-quinone oxidoreductase subunit L [Nocardioides immobilis]RHW26580.1 NADH-quinone oxidoreductase subunit L [Nocardioides immobilis]
MSSHLLLTAAVEAEHHIPVVAPTGADGVFSLLWLIIALPLFGAAVLLLGGKYTDKWGHYLGAGLPIGSFVISLICFFSVLGRDDADRQVSQHLFDWIQTGGLDIGMDLLYDPLSAMFLLLITGVGSLIHVYSIGYMAHDPRRRRFFGYLNLFVAAMLMLVLSENYVGLFLGWEGVGLASYLLIGFWQHKPSAAAAAKKAFVINRVGDMGMALAIFLMFVTFGTLSFSGISAAVSAGDAIGALDESTLNWIGVLLLIGACGKSAQVPLQAWLLDAMEGPTPVSALIHAATMVTAGVYLITRSNFIFELAPTAQTAVVIVATVTLLWGAILGCAKDDIKKGLAGSTMSQIGYMMLGAGLGVAGYAFAIFHLLTHGFFKANMFLGAGSVMHAMDDDVDMRHYGGLQKLLPVTFLTFAMGYLAIIGFPGFSGFFSKDKIIEVALTENLLVGLCALLGAGITGFYMTRMMLLTFFTKQRWEDGVHPHESPAVMTVPLIVLAALSVLGGVMLAGDWIVDFLSPVVGHAAHEEPPLPAIVITLIVVLVVGVGVALAFLLFQRRDVPREAPTDVSFVTKAARADLYGDAINDGLVVRPTGQLVTALVASDRGVVDGAFTGGATVVGGIGQGLRRLQTGYVRSYALSVLGGALILVLTLVAVNL